MNEKSKTQKRARCLKTENQREKMSTIFNSRVKWTLSCSSKGKVPPVCRFLYEVFQRIEDQYKALAAMKCPAPDNNESEMPAKRLRQDEETTGATREEIEEAMNFGVRKRKSRKERRRGRKKGSNNTVSPEVTRKLGDATLHYAQGHFDKRAIIFYMIAAHLTPKDASLWKLLLAKSIEHEDIKQAYYCLKKAISQ